MPIVWRYLLSQYLKVFFLSLVAFIAILLTTRLDEIAHFATLGSTGTLVLWFTLHQIPYILPIAIPIASLIAAILLVQRLSSSHEMTAFRAAGLSIKEILTPILIAGLFIATSNFIIISEIATSSHLSTGLSKMELKSINPLLVLHNKQLVRLKGIYSDTLGHSKIGEFANDILIAMPNSDKEQFNLIIAKNLNATGQDFNGKQVTLISPIEKTASSDQLLIENIGSMTTSIKDFAQILQKKVWTLNNDHLRLGLLKARIEDLKNLQANTSNDDLKLQQINKMIHRSYADILRRISISLAAFVFTLMGLSFGMSISRYKSNKGTLIVVALAAFYIVAFFGAKGTESNLWLTSGLYFIPLIIISLISIEVLRRLSKGIES